jgi:hypothetical protein
LNAWKTLNAEKPSPEQSSVSGTDVVRLAWLIGMGVSLVGALWLLVELLIDVYAISSNPRTNGIAMFQQYTEAEVWIVVLVIGALAAFFLAAAGSYFGLAEVTLLLLLVGGAAVAAIPFYLHVRRRRVFSAVRLRRPRRPREA